MNYYEIVYIIHPALQAGHLDDTINKINDKINQLKGKILFFENWGKKKLSYLIQKQKFGTYIFFQCELNGDNVNELSNDFEHNSNIIRHLITNIDAKTLMEQKKNNNVDEKKSQTTMDNQNSLINKETKEKKIDNKKKMEVHEVNVIPNADDKKDKNNEN